MTSHKLRSTNRLTGGIMPSADKNSLASVMPRNTAEIDAHVDGIVEEMNRRLEDEFAEELAQQSKDAN